MQVSPRSGEYENENKKKDLAVLIMLLQQLTVGQLDVAVSLDLKHIGLTPPR